MDGHRGHVPDGRALVEVDATRPGSSDADGARHHGALVDLDRLEGEQGVFGQSAWGQEASLRYPGRGNGVGARGESRDEGQRSKDASVTGVPSKI